MNKLMGIEFSPALFTEAEQAFLKITPSYYNEHAGQSDHTALSCRLACNALQSFS
ncbi:MAG: hypothetical protein R6U19_05820 [Bacteroidales bacterium]